MTEHDKRDPFENIKIATRCDSTWENMHGDDNVRMCPDCGFSVYNFANITESQASVLIDQNEPDKADTLYRRHDGTFMTADCPLKSTGSVFGLPHEIWRQIAIEFNGTFQKGTYNFLGDVKTSPEVYVVDDAWTITLDTFKQDNLHFTRMTALFANPTHFEVALYRNANPWISELGKRLGFLQDITVGHEPFDKHFIIQGNDEQKVKDLFAHAKLRDLLMHEWSFVGLQIADKAGATGEIYGNEMNFINDKQRLRHLFKLFITTLDQLKATGIATPWRTR